jgi:RNA polymerase primary sigma factor
VSVLESATVPGAELHEHHDEEIVLEPREEARLALSDDPVRQYLNEVGRYALLTAEEEADLAKRYEAGLAARRRLVSRTKLTPRRRAQLLSIVRDGAASKDRMVRSNLRLVVSQAKKWMGRGIDLLELIQEGNLGLIRAVEKFDHTKGYKFSTYAVWWVRQALQRGVSSKARTIRVPVHIWELSGKLRRVEIDLRQELGRDPTDEEVADKAGVPVDRLQEVRDALIEASSLDRPVGEDGDATLGDLLADAHALDPEDSAAERDVRERIEVLLADLDQRDRRILELRFGFVDGRSHTLDEIGAVFGMSRERIRQLERDALMRLRQERGLQLRPLLEGSAAA